MLMYCSNHNVDWSEAMSKIVDRYSSLTLDAFGVMPNHVHGILELGDGMIIQGWTGLTSSQKEMLQNLGAIV